MSERTYWWVKEGYGLFDIGEEGYPDPGQVIKRYRELRGMRPSDLASELGMTDVAVRTMESKKTGLDSIALRRRLIELLAIPAALMGLDGLHPPATTRSCWWVEEDYPLLGKGSDGYPNPGQVVKYYRDRKKQGDNVWTQIGLGIALNISDVAVRVMENNNESLDSIARRRALVFILDIPPVLLGLDSLHYLPKVETLFWTKNASDLWLPDEGIFTRYDKSLALYWSGYYASTIHAPLQAISDAIRDLRSALFDARGNQKLQGQKLLCRYYQLGCTIARDQCNYRVAFAYANQAVKLARSLGDHELIASAFMRRGFISFEQNEVEAAVLDLDAALPSARLARASLKGLAFQVAGHFHTHTAYTDADRDQALRLMDEAASIARSGPFEDDENFVRFNAGWYHAERAEALIALKKPKNALKTLDLAEEGIDSDQPRRHSHISIFRAKAHICKCDFADATDIAISALGGAKAVQSNIQVTRVLALYKQLKRSPYGNSPAVTRLGLMLRA